MEKKAKEIEELFGKIIDMSNKTKTNPKQMMHYILNNDTKAIEKDRKRAKNLEQFRKRINEE